MRPVKRVDRTKIYASKHTILKTRDMEQMDPIDSYKPADRLGGVKEYYFSRKLREIADMRAAGRDIISLGIGSPDLPPSESTIKTLAEEAAKEQMHGYQSYVGMTELRENMANWYHKVYGVSLNPKNEIQPLMGSKEGILHVTLAFVNPGDTVLVPNPGYPTYTSLSKLLGADVAYYDLDEAHGWLPDFEALDKMDLKKVKLMWVNYPHMPTGTPATMDLFEKLVSFAKKHKIILVHDNPYSLILNDKPLSILSVKGAKDCCIEFNSMSKSHNMAGWRVGLLASNPQFVQWIIQVISNINSGMFAPLQLAAAKALDNEPTWHDANNAVYRKRRKIAEDIMTLLGCTFRAEQVGMFLWGRIPDDYKDVEELTEKVLHEAEVFITPGFIFGSNGARYVRISLCCPEDKLTEAKQRIQNIF